MEVIIKQIHELLQAYDKVGVLIEVLRFIVIMFSIMGVLSMRKLKTSIRKWRSRRLIGFNKNLKTEVILPTFKGNLDFSPQEIIEQGGRIRSHDYITVYESEALLFIQDLMNDLGIRKKVVLKGSDDSFIQESNKIVIGGPLSNKYLHDIFSANSNGIYSFGGKFTFGVKKDWITREYDNYYSDLEEELPSNESIRKLFYIDKQGRKKEIDVPHKYVVLIKLNKKDFSCINSGPMLICFGDSGFSTNRAVQCLTDSLNELSKHVKNKRHFFVVLKCTSRGDIQFSEPSAVVDLTDVMI